MKFLRLTLATVSSVSLLLGCATPRDDIPLLSSWPDRPATVVGYISSKGDKGQVQRSARELEADALILVGISTESVQLAPPKTQHFVARSMIEAGGNSHSFDENLRTYAAIKWAPASRPVR